MEASQHQNLNNWVNHNRELLLRHKGKWVAYNENGLLLAHESLKELRKEAGTNASDYFVYFVHPSFFGQISFRAIHFRSVFFHEWTPLYPVELAFHDKKMQLSMLIDSGADGSLISYQTGLELGLRLADGETRQEARGVGGGIINYVWRDIQITIDGHALKVPTAWVIEGENQENIIGRQLVFDVFDIEFKQADETIVFKYRGLPEQAA
jgi:hypothetical protein